MRVDNLYILTKQKHRWNWRRCWPLVAIMTLAASVGVMAPLVLWVAGR